MGCSSQFSSCAPALKLGGWWVCAESIARVGCSSQFSSCAVDLRARWVVGVCGEHRSCGLFFSVLQLCSGSKSKS